jgi:hypothetical protein
LKFVAARSNAACQAEDAVRDAGHARETCDRGNENFFRRPTRMSGASKRTRPSKSLIPAVWGGFLTSLPIFEYRPVQMDDLDPHRTETQKEWKDWADHGYRKMYQPRSTNVWRTPALLSPALDFRPLRRLG